MAFDADIRIEGERIVEIGAGISPKRGESVLDARGLLVLPGGVDPHVHLTRRPSLSAEVHRAENLASSSRAALAGGITSVGEIASPDGKEGLLDTIDRVGRDVRAMAFVDVFVHPVLGSTKCKLDHIESLAMRGQPSLKVFLMDPEIAADPVGLENAVRRAADAGVTVLMHCECLPELTAAQEVLHGRGTTSLQYLPESRPKESEIRATEWAIDLSRRTGATVYAVHVSCAEALELLNGAREERLPVHVETRPEFLYLTAACHRGERRKLHVIIPPLRENADCEALWQGLADGAIDTVATDDAPFWAKQQKLEAPDSFDELRMGVAGLQLIRPMLFSEGVLKGRIPLERFVDVTATAPARIFGLLPRKGDIAVGADADLVLWDPKETREISANRLFTRTGFSLYEGWKVTGWPRMTLRRGEIAFADGEILARPGTGELIPRCLQLDGEFRRHNTQPLC